MRLGIMVYLANAESADFTELKTVLEATQGNLSRLNDVIVIAFNRQDMKKALQKLGAESKTTSPREFAELIRRDLAENSKMVQAAGLAAPAPK